jgi:tetratricopeptide (TPR) repeat protein
VSYKEANYREAIDFYSKAIGDLLKKNDCFKLKFSFLIKDFSIFTELCPKNAAYYGNRAAAFIMINKYKETIDDASTCTRLDPNFVKVNKSALKSQQYSDLTNLFTFQKTKGLL